MEHPDPGVHHLLQQTANMQRRLDAQNVRPAPMQNLFAYRRVANPPINNGGIAANNFELKPELINRAEEHMHLVEQVRKMPTST